MRRQSVDLLRFAFGRDFAPFEGVELPRGSVLLGELVQSQRHIDILEDLTGGNAEDSVGEFDEVVALRARVLPAEDVGESEVGVELFGFDQKAGAIGSP